MNETYNAMQHQDLNFDNNGSSINDSMLIANQECGLSEGASAGQLLSPPEMRALSKIEHVNDSSTRAQNSTLSVIQRRISDYPR